MQKFGFAPSKALLALSVALWCWTGTASAQCVSGTCREGMAIVKGDWKTMVVDGEERSLPGGTYVGELAGGKPDGIGATLWYEPVPRSSGTVEKVYVGMFKNAEPHGRGILWVNRGAGVERTFIATFEGGAEKLKDGTKAIEFDGYQDITVHSVNNGMVKNHMNDMISLYCHFQPNRVFVREKCSELSIEERNERVKESLAYIYDTPVISRYVEEPEKQQNPREVIRKIMRAIKANMESAVRHQGRGRYSAEMVLGEEDIRRSRSTRSTR